MIRYEFIEFLIRVARAKYIETGKTKDYEYALDQLFRDFIPNWDSSSIKVQEWRNKYLWTLDVNDCFEINLESLKKLYKFLLNKSRKVMNNKEAMGFMQNGAQLKKKLTKRESAKDFAENIKKL